MNGAVKPNLEVKDSPVMGELRVQAITHGLALSGFQQREKQRKLRLGRKRQSSK
jgi:hypothetical protein